jgi:RNA polymerase sigma-70 factor (ECF subfamily)
MRSAYRPVRWTERRVARDVRSELVEIMPRLRRFGIALTRSLVDADDLVQAACERALSRGAQLHSETKIAAWMYAIMRNLWFDEMRAQGARRADPIETASDVAGDDGEAIAERNDTLAAVRRALALLPEQQRSALILVCVDELTYAEAATTLGVSIGTVASRVARGRQALHERLLAESSAVDARARQAAEADSPGLVRPVRSGLWRRSPARKTV